MDKKLKRKRVTVDAGSAPAGSPPADAAGADDHATAGDAGAPGGPSGSVGAVAVEVDREAILAEAAAVAASSSSSDAAAAPLVDVGAAASIADPDPQAKAADVAPAVRLLVAQCCMTFAPGWQVTREESDGVGDAAALVLAHWMPAGVIEPKYLAIVTLATSLYGVASKRRREDGTWAPLRVVSSATPPARVALAV